MLSFKNNKFQGFSLVETVIVLGITIGVLLLPTIEISNLKNSFEKTQIINTFKSNFNNGTKHAVVNQTTVTIKYNKQMNLIYFYFSNNQINRMQLPDGMTVTGLSKDLRISKNGSVAPKTLTFKTKDWQKVLKIQMKWGQLIETD